MFFFVHGEIVLGVIFYGFPLVLKHAFLHGHEFADCVCFESVQQMFKSISKHFGVFIDDLGQNFSFSFEVLLSLAAGLNLAVLLMYVLFEGRGGRFLTEVASASGAISVKIWFAFAGDL